ncbi:hypothetical protein [Marinibacterium sp. SX1]|uniref:hypothetical protein n=1 Tax=Marinibacterium sp. SX1 TaxID=3388424 RepID=UPI003D17FFD8
MTELTELRRRIADNEVKGGSAFGRAVAEVIALTAEAHAQATPAELTAALDEACAWGITTKPSMTSVRAVADLARATMHAQGDGPGLSQAVVRAMRGFVADSERAILALAQAGTPLFRDGITVMTHSFSESLINVLRHNMAGLDAAGILLTESRPLRESRLMASMLADLPAGMTLFSDAGMGIAAPQADVAIVGADAILADGSMANKTGSLPLALICREYGVPFYVAAELSKVHLGDSAEVDMEIRPDAELVGDWDMAATGRVTVVNQFFEVVPAALITGYITDGGLLAPADCVAAARAPAAA